MHTRECISKPLVHIHHNLGPFFLNDILQIQILYKVVFPRKRSNPLNRCAIVTVKKNGLKHKLTISTIISFYCYFSPSYFYQRKLSLKCTRVYWKREFNHCSIQTDFIFVILNNPTAISLIKLGHLHCIILDLVF